jgi:hypothetical protein
LLNLEITREPAIRKVFAAVVRYFGIQRPGGPLTVVGDRFFEGYHDDATTGAEIKKAVAACLQFSCRDVVLPLLTGEEEQALPQPLDRAHEVPKVLSLPVFGEISLAHVSLPMLTIMLAAIDGFNPCAMWTLVFLISLLVGLRDRFRMWVLGSIFIGASAAVYYLFMAAWLNVLLFLGMLFWIRLLVGFLALGGGGYYLHEYFVNPEAICKVTAPSARRRVLEQLRSLASERSFVLAAAGIVLLAFVVNLVELICSAGIPAQLCRHVKVLLTEQFLYIWNRPISADRDWLLYGDEYYRMKFGNTPSAVIHLTSNSVLCATGTCLKPVI